MQSKKNKQTLPITMSLLFIALTLCFVLYSLASAVVAVFNPARYGLQWGPDMLYSVLLQIAIVGVLALVAAILWDLRRNYTPFTFGNIKRLRAIGIILLAAEPLQLILGALLNHYRPAIGNQKTMYMISSGGVFVAVGLAVVCLSVAFNKGLQLQQQADETL